MLSSASSNLSNVGSSLPQKQTEYPNLITDQKKYHEYVRQMVLYAGLGFLDELKQIVTKVGISTAKTLAQITYTTKSSGTDSLNSGKTPLYNAVSTKQLDTISYLINELEVNPNVKCFGKTPLHAAIRNGHEPTITLLLKLEADPLLKDDRNGQTALEFAIQRGFGHLFNGSSSEPS